MRAALLGMAASLAAIAVPAQAQSWDGPGAGSGEGSGSVRVHRNSGSNQDRLDVGEWRDGDRGDRIRGRRFQETVVLLGPSEDWDGNRSWDADRWNDWWHERPWRSYPRWVHSNGKCDRMWWGGGAWRCGW